MAKIEKKPKASAGKKAALTRRINKLDLLARKFRGDRGLWDKTLSPGDLLRNERFVGSIEMLVRDLSRVRREMDL